MTSPAQNDPDNNWLTVDEVAKLYRISRDMVYKRIRAHAWDGFITHFGRTLVSRAGLAEWLAAGGDQQCRTDFVGQGPGVANTGARSSRPRKATPSSDRRSASAKSKLEQLQSGGTAMRRFREIK